MDPKASKPALQRMIRGKAESLKAWINGFLRDCQVRELSPFTIRYYRAQLTHFEAYAAAQGVSEVTEITAALLRDYLLQLEAAGHNPGGRRSKYIAVRVFLSWWEREAEPEGWTNPIAKVKPPKITRDVIAGARMEDIKAMLATCSNDFLGLRDRAVILCLLDTGARAREFLSLDLSDVDTISGSVILRKTKARKPRTVFIGRKSRRALRAYLKIRDDDNAAVWVTRAGDRLAMPSFQGLLKRRGRLAGLQNKPSAHDFRRAFALASLRAGMDVITLARLMGHSTLEVLTRYLKQSADDLHAAHDRAGVVDRGL